MVWLVEGRTGRCALSARISNADLGELARMAGSALLKGSASIPSFSGESER
jgi:hypothetical protein